MTTKGHKNLAIQVNSVILRKLRSIARTEGHTLQALINEALANLIETRKQPRPHVMAAYQSSHEKFGSLYKKLSE